MAKSKSKSSTDFKEQQLDDVLNLIYKVCKNKGWTPHLQNKDTETFKYATVEVFKYFSKEHSDEKVLAAIDIDVIQNQKVKFHINKTSFYGYGVDALARSLQDELKEIDWIKKSESEPKTSDTDIQIVENILNRFDRAVRQLKRRYDNRPAIDVKDEYDVQDVVHSILRCYFDDLRPEDYTPSYAGSCSRVDFLLKKEKIVIEVKYATNKLKDKKIGEQLIIDIKRYETHPDCRTLFCFVYDPDGNIQNPIALENDLSGTHGKNNLQVKVIITPK